MRNPGYAPVFLKDFFRNLLLNTKAYKDLLAQVNEILKELHVEGEWVRRVVLMTKIKLVN